MLPSPSPRGEPLFISGRYRIRRKLGAGIRGNVYLADDEREGRPVALKVLRTEILDDEAILAVQTEFRALASLRHPQIAAAYDFGYIEPGRLPFYSREYVAGEPLSPGPPPSGAAGTPERFLAPVLDLLEALHYLHSHDILHLDIHAGNLIVAEDATRGTVLIDFGLIRRRDRRASAPVEARPSVAPELLAGGSPGPQADLFAAGRVLAMRLTGDPSGDGRHDRNFHPRGPRPPRTE